PPAGGRRQVRVRASVPVHVGAARGAGVPGGVRSGGGGRGGPGGCRGRGLTRRFAPSSRREPVSRAATRSDHWCMTQTLPSRRADTVVIRAYRAIDHQACRQLWAELASEHRSRYPNGVDVGPAAADASAEMAPPGAVGFAGPREAAGDPGAGFEEYLTRLDLSGMW